MIFLQDLQLWVQAGVTVSVPVSGSGCTCAFFSRVEHAVPRLPFQVPGVLRWGAGRMSW